MKCKIHTWEQPYSTVIHSKQMLEKMSFRRKARASQRDHIEVVGSFLHIKFLPGDFQFKTTKFLCQYSLFSNSVLRFANGFQVTITPCNKYSSKDSSQKSMRLPRELGVSPCVGETPRITVEEPFRAETLVGISWGNIYCQHQIS